MTAAFAETAELDELQHGRNPFGDLRLWHAVCFNRSDVLHRSCAETGLRLDSMFERTFIGGQARHVPRPLDEDCGRNWGSRKPPSIRSNVVLPDTRTRRKAEYFNLVDLQRDV